MNLRIDSSQALSEAGRIDRMDRAIEGRATDKSAQFGSELGKGG